MGPRAMNLYLEGGWTAGGTGRGEVLDTCHGVYFRWESLRWSSRRDRGAYVLMDNGNSLLWVTGGGALWHRVR